MIELLVALVAGLVGGLLSRYIPAFPKRLKQKYHVGTELPGPHSYEVKRDKVTLYIGNDLRVAKLRRSDNPGSVLIADGVNRG